MGDALGDGERRTANGEWSLKIGEAKTAFRRRNDNDDDDNVLVK